ncbi:hypothetical protein LTR85_000771 [Meristemomyces frigidus]|nr:hypothetical protein LTR85_000771 [Meristemomyces frigidus]
MRLGYYAGASTAAAAACLLKAFHQRPNFYSATVYLSQSNACLLILTNLLLVTACSFMYALQRLLYGPLRPIEMEQLSEKAWYAVLDTLLAMPSFREDVGGWLLTMFVLLLAGKVWGWIGEGRVDVLEQQPPADPRLFHARLATSLILSVVFDLFMLDYCVETVMADPRPGMMVIFTFEFAVLSVFSTFTLSRYCLSLIQTRIEKKQMQEAIETRKDEIRAERIAARQNETADGRPAPASPPAEEEPIDVDENEVDVPGWEDKRRYLFALEVLTDFVKLVIYVVFFTVSITFNGLPMHIMRDVYMTFASFSKRVTDYVAYRKATSDMNTRYPDATTEEIRGDACIVCREAMVAWEQPAPANASEAQTEGQQPPQAAQPAQPQARRDEGLRAKKLPCNHILHLRCLKAWLERQQVCPTCRRPVITPADGAAQPGQPGAPGANGAIPGQAGQPGQPAQNRARIFNLGPVRIGFLNGPGDQIQNIVNQMRNNPQADPNQAGALNAAAAAPPQQQGPNHLGLQNPYLAGGHLGHAHGAARAAVPTQIQMMQLEQRLMQEAHNLGVEQQQLAVLRLMEAEMARLRAGHLPAHLPVGTGMAAQRQAHGFQMGGGMPAFAPSHVHPQAPEMLRGNPQQQLANGANGLPQGLVLPEGWTVMPLSRSAAIGGAQGVPGTRMTSSRAGGVETTRHVAPPSSPAGQQAAPAAPAASGNAPAIQTTTNGAASAPTATASDGQAGPADESGSPLFVPTAAVASNATGAVDPTLSSAQPPPNPPATEQAAPATDARQAPQLAASEPSGSSAPWTANDGWSFVGQNGDTSTNGQPPQPAENQVPAADGSPAESTVQPADKGKGRAVELEDASDEEEM